MLIAKENLVSKSRKIHPHGIFWVVQRSVFSLNEAYLHGKYAYFVFSCFGVISGFHLQIKQATEHGGVFIEVFLFGWFFVLVFLVMVFFWSRSITDQDADLLWSFHSDVGIILWYMPKKRPVLEGTIRNLFGFRYLLRLMQQNNELEK